ncbi:hypothetical protein CBR_g34821 [Chara braunii]|uniref:Uncharacterized protein n=1 Tax=Chara braunii TaxID=69332 RepID=A0A388LJE1_CHABU|nr:hypothetical protein CBR_g34821 [Chara braunii]|eukprot:GBG82444.1 hypothetical protein CBR_g34821 [Chara braunii]
MAGHTEGGKEGLARKEECRDGGRKCGVLGSKKLRGICSFGWSLNRCREGLEGLEIMLKSSRFCLGHDGQV